VLPSTIEGALAHAVECRRLLDHPYYRKWQTGALSTKDLARYAGQYRHFERLLPEVLAAISRTVDAGPARWLTENNLRDERSRPEPHLDLFDRFAAAVGADPADSPFPATRELVDLYRSSAAAGPVPALAVIAGYEVQAAEIAATKADALRLHHRLNADQTRFWDVHARIEQTHAGWTNEALHLLGAHPDTVEHWAARSALAWWTFLDEQDAAIFD
jgi:pyrroloquinoline quinone (PQQ) biosynthesis protein C